MEPRPVSRRLPRLVRFISNPAPLCVPAGNLRMKKEERGSSFCHGPSFLQKETTISIVLPKPTTASEVEAHNHAVRQQGADRTCYRKVCARCDADGRFAAHDLRRRGLRLIVDHSVLCVTVWLARWRCRKCRYIFTDYPDFRTPV